MKLSIITMNYRSAPLLKRLVESIERWHRDVEHEVMVVNNWPAEKDEVAQLVAGKQNVRLLSPSRNFYFAPSINWAARQAKGQYLVFLNVDTYFTEASLLKMLAYLEANQTYGVTVGTIRNHPSGGISPSGNQLPTIWTELVRHTFLAKLWNPDWYKDYLYASWDRNSDRDIMAGCDAFLMIRAEVFKKIGGYSQGLLMYNTEEDIGRKLRQAGLKMRHLANATIWHDWSHSTKKVARAKILAIMVWDRYVYFGSWVLCAVTMILNPYILLRLPAVLYWLGKISEEVKQIQNDQSR